jgi:hypothetical protein
MGNRENDERYSEQEARKRFEKLVKCALNTCPSPHKDVPKKWSRAQRHSSKAIRKAVSSPKISALEDPTGI